MNNLRDVPRVSQALLLLFVFIALVGIARFFVTKHTTFNWVLLVFWSLYLLVVLVSLLMPRGTSVKRRTDQ